MIPRHLAIAVAAMMILREYLARTPALKERS